MRPTSRIQLSYSTSETSDPGKSLTPDLVLPAPRPRKQVIPPLPLTSQASEAAYESQPMSGFSRTKALPSSTSCIQTAKPKLGLQLKEGPSQMQKKGRGTFLPFSSHKVVEHLTCEQQSNGDRPKKSSTHSSGARKIVKTSSSVQIKSTIHHFCSTKPKVEVHVQSAHPSAASEPRCRSDLGFSNSRVRPSVAPQKPAALHTKPETKSENGAPPTLGLRQLTRILTRPKTDNPSLLNSGHYDEHQKGIQLKREPLNSLLERSNTRSSSHSENYNQKAASQTVDFIREAPRHTAAPSNKAFSLTGDFIQKAISHREDLSHKATSPTEDFLKEASSTTEDSIKNVFSHTEGFVQKPQNAADHMQNRPATLQRGEDPTTRSGRPIRGSIQETPFNLKRANLESGKGYNTALQGGRTQIVMPGMLARARSLQPDPYPERQPASITPGPAENFTFLARSKHSNGDGWRRPTAGRGLRDLTLSLNGNPWDPSFGQPNPASQYYLKDGAGSPRSLAQAELEFARAEAEAKQAAAHQIQTRQINILRQSCQRAGLSRAVEEGLEQVSYCLPDIFDLDEETIEALARVEEDAALQTVCELAEIRGPVVENISVYLKKLMNKVVTQKATGSYNLEDEKQVILEKGSTLSKIRYCNPDAVVGNTTQGTSSEFDFNSLLNAASKDTPTASQEPFQSPSDLVWKATKEGPPVVDLEPEAMIKTGSEKAPSQFIKALEGLTGNPLDNIIQDSAWETLIDQQYVRRQKAPSRPLPTAKLCEGGQPESPPAEAPFPNGATQADAVLIDDLKKDNSEVDKEWMEFERAHGQRMAALAGNPIAPMQESISMDESFGPETKAILDILLGKAVSNCPLGEDIVHDLSESSHSPPPDDIAGYCDY